MGNPDAAGPQGALEKRGGTRCWCGNRALEPYSAEYRVCRACGTLVSQGAAVPAAELYSESYWLERQKRHHGLPDIHARARLDLPERAAYWLAHLLQRKLPPGRILEVGCGHGGYVALLNWAGFDALGTEMSDWVTGFAARSFGVTVLRGPVEAQPLAPGSFDVIVVNDVLEHLPDPVATFRHCASLLSPAGFFVIQTPEYREHLAHADLVRTSDLFLKHIDGNSDEHLFLFSRRSATRFFAELGFPEIEFSNPVYSYDLFFTASRQPLARQTPEAIGAALVARPTGRLVQALLDKAAESADRWWAIQRLESGGKR